MERDVHSGKSIGIVALEIFSPEPLAYYCPAEYEQVISVTGILR
jgi:hypothetical protein